MANAKRYKTRYPGIFYRIVDRVGGPGQERMYYVVFKKDGKIHEEKAGRQYADRMTEAKAARIRAERIEGRRQSRKEIRDAAKERGQQWTIGRLADAYFDSLANNPAKSRKAAAIDRNRYKNYIQPEFAKKRPEQLLPLDIERLRRELQKTTCTLRAKDAPPRTLSPATIRAALTLFKRIINYGNRNGWCAGLAFRITMPKVSNVVIEDLNQEELRRLMAAIEADVNEDARGLMLMALYTGMRRGELFKLQWTHIDFNRGFIRIIGPKGGTDQTIPLNQAARKVLEGLHRKSAYVFPGEDGGQRVTMQKALRRIRKAAGLPPSFRPLHGLRHAFASRLASSGKVDMYTLQRLLTHKSPVMTQRYAHLRDEALRNASELAGTLVDEALKSTEQKSAEAASE
jgi:integrase